MDLDIVILGCIKRNIVKQTDAGIFFFFFFFFFFVFTKKKEYACSSLRKLEGMFVCFFCLFFFCFFFCFLFLDKKKKYVQSFDMSWQWGCKFVRHIYTPKG